MPTFKHMIRTAQTRELINRVLARGGFGLLMGLSAGLILLLLDRFTGSVQIDWPVYAAAGFAGFGIGAIQAFITRVDAMTMAVYLDRALKLKDRIGTIEALESKFEDAQSRHGSYDPEFAALLRADTARLAAGIHVRAVTPIQMRPAWLACLGLAALLWAGVNFLPEIASADAGDSSSTDSIAKLQQRELAAREIQQSIQSAADALPQSVTGDEQLQNRLDALDRLAEQLSSDTPLDERELATTRDETAAAMNELADQLTEQAERDRAAAEELQRRFASMDQQHRPEPPMSAREFSEALRRGDFGQAARSLEDLLNNAEAFTEDEKAATASHLRELGKHIQQSQAAQPDPRIDERKQQAEDALRNLGVDDDQTLQELLDPDASRLQEDLEQTLRENNIDQELARKLARELRELNRQQQVDEQVRDEARDLSDTLNRAADNLQAPPPSLQPPQPQPAQPQPPQPPQDQPQPAKDQQKQSQDPEKPRQQQQPEERNQNEQQSGNAQDSQQQQDSQSKQQQSAEGDQQQQQRSAESKQQGGQREESSRKQGEQKQESAQQEQGEQSQQGEQQQQREGQQKPAGDSSKQPEAQRQPGAQRNSQESGRPQPSPAQPGVQTPGQPAPSTDPDSGQQQSDSTQQRQAHKQPGQPGEQSERQPASPQDQAQDLQSQPSDEFDPSKVDPESLQKMLKRLAERPRNAQDKQQVSERMRQRARELADNMTPEQRRQWAEALQREMGEQEGGQQAPESEQDSEHEARNDPNQPAIIQQPHKSNGSAGTPRGTEQANRQRQQPSTLPERSTEDLNLTGDETADKLIAQWLSDQQQLEPSPSGASGDAAKAPAPAPIRRAQDLAERAVNDAAVHRRYHQAIKRYFGRLDQTARKAAEQKNTQSTPQATPGRGGQ